MSYNGATATWSGYNHQGKVGLFVALSEMARILDEDKPQTVEDKINILNGWCVEFEGAEDFDICRLPTSAGSANVYSRHQVKAYRTTPSQDASKIDTYSAVLNPTVRKTKRHQEGVTVPGFRTEILDINGDSLNPPQFVPVGARFLHVIENITDWVDDGEKNTNQVHRYYYPSLDGGEGEPFCTFSEVEVNEQGTSSCPLFKRAFIEINRITGPETKTEAEGRIIWQTLQAQLQNMICKAHATNERVCVSFNYIFTTVQNGGDIEEYKADSVRRRLSYEWQLLQEERAFTGEAFDEDWRRVEAWFNNLQEMDTVALKSAIQSLSPDDGLEDLTLQKEGLKKVVCHVIKNVKTTPFKSGHHYSRHSHKYFLTTITQGERLSPLTAGQIKKNILEKRNTLFADSKIVTLHQNYSFTELLEKDEFSQADASATIAGKDKLNFTQYSPQELITAQNAIGELSEDGD